MNRSNPPSTGRPGQDDKFSPNTVHRPSLDRPHRLAGADRPRDVADDRDLQRPSFRGERARELEVARKVVGMRAAP